ncbi:hypothetical protein GCM10023190_22700 [Enteractinococcus fodinae]
MTARPVKLTLAFQLVDQLNIGQRDVAVIGPGEVIGDGVAYFAFTRMFGGLGQVEIALGGNSVTTVD